MYHKIFKNKVEKEKIPMNFADKTLEEASKALKKLKEKETIEETGTKRFSAKGYSKPNPDLIFDLQNKAKKKLSIEESIQRISTEKYSVKKLEAKLEEDLKYFIELGRRTLQLEESKIKYAKIVKDLITETAALYKETNVTPRKLSLAISNDNSLEENFRIYTDHLIHSLEENFRKPLLSGKLIEENIEPAKKIIKITVMKGGVDNLDPAKLAMISPFMDTVKDHLKEVVIPDNAEEKINDFVNAQDPSYSEQPGNAISLLNSIDDKLNKLCLMLSSKLFNDKIDLGEDNFDSTPYTIAKTLAETPEKEDEIENNLEDEAVDIDKATDPEDVEDDVIEDVQNGALEDDDKNHDGKKDSEEDHEELPDDFEGDHKDAEKQSKK